ncbi:MAG: NUDIX hydrolase [Phycisphaerales bacterium]
MPRAGERETIHAGKKFAFERLWTAGSDGGLVERLVVRHPGAVCVLGLLGSGADREVVLIRNDRPAVGDVLWELPAGTIDAGEDPIVTAGRELEEESGYRAESIEPMGSFFTTPGMTDEVMHAFVATGLRRVGQRLEPDERIEVHAVRFSRAMEMVDAGEIRDGKSMLTLLLAERRGLVSRGG